MLISERQNFNDNVAVVFEATRHIIKLYQHRRRKNKKTERGATLIIRKEMPEHVSSACVSGRKVPFATSGWSDPPQRKRSTKIQPNGKCDRNGSLTR